MGIAVDTPKRRKPAYSPPPPSALSVVVPHSDRFRSSSDRAIVATRSAPPRPPASIGLLHVRACVRDWVCRAFLLSAVLPPSPRRLMPRSSDFGLRPPARYLKAWAMKIITAPWNLRVCRASMPLRSCANYTYYSNWYWSQTHRLPPYRVVYNLGLPISRGRERGSARVALPPTPSQQLFRHFVVLLQIRGSESEGVSS